MEIEISLKLKFHEKICGNEQSNYRQMGELWTLGYFWTLQNFHFEQHFLPPEEQSGGEYGS